MKTKLIFIGLAAIVQLTGCYTPPRGYTTSNSFTQPNGFSQFYQDRAGDSITNFPPYSESTKILTASNTTNDVRELCRSGYGLIGVSAFQGPPQANDALMSQAKQVGADVVLYSCIYLGNEQAAVSQTQYQPGHASTTISSGAANANAFGSGGYAHGTGNYFGTSTTITPGTYSTQTVPVTVPRYKYEAGFFRKLRPPAFGVFPRPLPSEIRQQLERNTGVVAWVVINDSPAFYANILEGDVILKMNGEDVLSAADFMKKAKAFAGQKIDVDIWRNGQLKTISVQLNTVGGP